ncbi:hypothetical protein DERP_013730 [Dermatophagoides pteronyssinus]|uniref:Glutathione S-transferase 1-like n=1 Tax=Dermatophagoides pteronyssinus TaxID=6956 RepID=A0ABQ8JF90_DERPT|nr:hypothetical protein DERP_013730 [Dermatophagoides pteronyssinus]
MKPIDLYVAPISPTSRAVIIAARYMQINIKLIIIDLMKGEQKQDWFVKMNPQHCLPTINDNGFILWESRAIMTYMANKYAPNNSIYPVEPRKRGRVDCLLQYDLNVLNRAITDLMIPLINDHHHHDHDHDDNNQKRKNNQSSTKFMNTIKQRKVNKSLEYLESILIESNFLVDNHLTLADFSIYCSLEFAEKYHYNFDKYPNLQQYFKRLKQLLGCFVYFPNNNNDDQITIDNDRNWINDQDDKNFENQQQQPLNSNSFLLCDNQQQQSFVTTTTNFNYNNGH